MKENDEKRLLIYERISKVMQDLSAVGKNQVNQEQRFKFRGIDDIYNAVHKIMAKHEVFTTVKILDSKIEEIVSRKGAKGYRCVNKYLYTFFTVDGSNITTETFGEAIDYGDKALNKCAAIAHKYALMQIYCIPTEDVQDPDSECHELSSVDKCIPKSVIDSMIKAFEMIKIERDELNAICHETTGKNLGDDLKTGDLDKLKAVYKECLSKKKHDMSDNKSDTTEQLNKLVK